MYHRTEIELNLPRLSNYLDGSDEYDGYYITVQIDCVREEQTRNHPGYEDFDVYNIENIPDDLPDKFVKEATQAYLNDNPNPVREQINEEMIQEEYERAEREEMKRKERLY